MQKGPASLPGLSFHLSTERLDLEVHATHAAHAAHAAATRRHAAAGVLLRHFGHHGFGGDQESRDRSALNARKPPGFPSGSSVT